MKSIAAAIGLIVTLTFIAPALGEEPTAESYMKFFKYFEGKWEFSASEGNQGTIVFEVSPTQKCLIWRATLNGKPAVHGIQGYDPAKKCWRNVRWHADGALAVSIVQFDAETLNAGPIGKSYEVKSMTVKSDGKQERQKAIFTIRGQDMYEWGAGDLSAVVSRVKDDTE
jgi:hypothetical protein